MRLSHHFGSTVLKYPPASKRSAVNNLCRRALFGNWGKVAGGQSELKRVTIAASC